MDKQSGEKGRFIERFESDAYTHVPTRSSLWPGCIIHETCNLLLTWFNFSLNMGK